ncbi:hypothetical protein GUITHDRAFT_115731 [Guillardia theta CCMP2712]|uniref:nucleoside-diphosphate kinase n=1 Tax=Guillardia theta (strain CCMP2712) TaxID=905079 RepID=L1IPG8_GUITC|nr:hypothetical protein GUITHDRAFT_115731 [Guillardia theta CCMP2712]EKX38186.1 hypothetical protein GUITHDRAFT_115731 [Guillardia theta CCMP2712]|eukprot:XP_005825166.1 hypothetical protein GUITHDRAFT_115731 [Guillardia theta CCMP2712]
MRTFLALALLLLSAACSHAKVSRGLVGAALTRFEQCGLKISQMRVYEKVPDDIIREHYKEHAARSFYPELVESMTSGTVVAVEVAATFSSSSSADAQQLRGSNAVARVRKMLGSTDPSAAEMGTFRADYGLDKTRNFMHASDSTESSAREVNLWIRGG